LAQLTVETLYTHAGLTIKEHSQQAYQIKTSLVPDEFLGRGVFGQQSTPNSEQANESCS
jgi:hypothetical protein